MQCSLCAVRVQNQNCYQWHVQMTIIHQDLWSGKLVPNPYKRSELSKRVFCTFSSRKERICKWIPISNNLEEETALVNVGILAKGVWNAKEWCFLTCLIGGGRGGARGGKVICKYTGCTLQTFVMYYDSTITLSSFFFRDSHFIRQWTFFLHIWSLSVRCFVGPGRMPRSS